MLLICRLKDSTLWQTDDPDWFCVSEMPPAPALIQAWPYEPICALYIIGLH